MIILKAILMKNQNNFKCLAIIFIILLFQSCQSQSKDNPKVLGEKKFKIDNVTFTEDVDTLFSKISFVKLDRTDDQSEALIYRNKIDSNSNRNIVSFYEMDSPRLNVITNNEKEIQAFTTYFETYENPQNIIEKIDAKFKPYRVNLKPNKKLEFSKSKSYQWNLIDKIYAVTISSLDDEYTVSVIVTKPDVDKKTLSVDSTPICLDNSCKE